ncbi:MAG: hypothetical protein AB7U41_00225 [Dongiaceae bacterium]
MSISKQPKSPQQHGFPIVHLQANGQRPVIWCLHSFQPSRGGPQEFLAFTVNEAGQLRAFHGLCIYGFWEQLPLLSKAVMSHIRLARPAMRPETVLVSPWPAVDEIPVAALYLWLEQLPGKKAKKAHAYFGDLVHMGRDGRANWLRAYLLRENKPKPLFPKHIARQIFKDRYRNN